jgi:LuxR family maltose regulon positive regulatory protein
LREAQQRGLFLVALDEQGEWFRYHHLFAEAIQAEARWRAPELVRSANDSAAGWFERHDDVVTALDHWLAADRPDEALRIALAAGYHLIDTGQVKSLERIMALIPASVVGKDPDRQIDYAMLHNHIDAQVCVSWLNEAERTIAALAVPDDELTRRYHAVRAMAHLLFGEWDDAESNAGAAIDQRGVGEGAGAATQRAGLHLMRAKGWLEAPGDAEQLFHTYVGSPWTPVAVRNVVAPCAWALAAAVGGRINEAERWCSRIAARGDEIAVPQAAHQELLLARVMVATELGDRGRAWSAIDELRAANVLTFHSLRAIAEVEVATGLIADDQLAEAASVLEILSESEAYASLGPRIHDAVDRAWTALHLVAGDVAGARQAATRMRVGFWRDATQAKVLLIDGETTRAADILASLSATSPRQQVTLLVLQASSLGDHDQEGRSGMVEAALAVASREGMLQTVVTAARGSVDMLELASSVAPDEWMHDVRRMLAKGGRGLITGRVATLYEQPTERERVVARYLTSRLTVPEIAQELGISQNTLKTHLKSLYRKLDVTSREDAVATSRRLGIIG